MSFGIFFFFASVLFLFERSKRGVVSFSIEHWPVPITCNYSTSEVCTVRFLMVWTLLTGGHLLLSPAGLLLRLSGLLVLLQLLPQDQTVDWDPSHVRPLFPAGHRHLRHHDVPDCGGGVERTRKLRNRAHKTSLPHIMFTIYRYILGKIKVQTGSLNFRWFKIALTVISKVL